MGVTFVLGRCGSGKSRYIRAEILERDRLSDTLFIVPRQYTVQAERDLIRDGAPGLLGVQVLSFSRLTHRIVSDMGGQNLPFLDTMGKCLKARLALNAARADLRVYNADTVGLPALLAGHFDYFQRFDITPEALSSTVSLLNDGYAKRRLRDIALVYQEYRRTLDGHFSAEDMIDRVIEEIPNCDWLKRSHIFIDGFEQIDSQTYRLVAALMAASRRLVITFCMDETNSPLLRPETAHFAKCAELAEALGVMPEMIRLPNEQYAARHICPQFSHLERYLFDHHPQPFSGEPDGIETYQFTDPYAEADFAAAKLVELARSGLRWRDMAVICPDEAFSALLCRTFAEYDIPCFMDRKHSVTGSAIAELALSAVRAAARWNADDVICLLKTGLTGVSDDDCEAFENYCIRCGVKPHHLKQPFTRGDSAAAEHARSVIIPPLLALETAFAGRAAGTMIDGLSAYFTQIGLDERVNELIASLPEDALAERLSLSEILNGLYELLEQAKLALGVMEISSGELYDMLLTGFVSRESAIIPTGADEVHIADLSRSKLSNIKALLIVGAADGKLPAVSADDGLISERDIETLSHYGVKLGQTPGETSDIARFQLYQAICKPDQYIWLSVSALNLAGEEQKPCALFDTLTRIFPDITVTKNVPLTAELQTRLLCAKKPAAPPDSFVYQRQIPPADAKRLYTDSVSVTGIEAYFQCPFMHFMQRGVRPVPRPERAFEKKDAGSFLHTVMDAFTRRLAASDETLLDNEESLRREMDAAFDDCLARYDDLTSGDSETAHIARRLRRVAQSMVKKLMRYFDEGNRIAGSEISFGGNFPAYKVDLPDGGDVFIKGKIDRVDIDKQGRLHVADYKTGGMAASFAELKNDLYNGIRLQLMMYTNMALQYADTFGASGSDALGGASYIALRDEIVSCKMDDAQYSSVGRERDKFTQKGIRVGDSVRGEGEITYETMREWLDFADQKSKDGLYGIFSGDIQARPLNKTNVCGYCDYAPICGFDGRGGRKYEKVERLHD